MPYPEVISQGGLSVWDVGRQGQHNSKSGQDYIIHPALHANSSASNSHTAKSPTLFPWVPSRGSEFSEDWRCVLFTTYSLESWSPSDWPESTHGGQAPGLTDMGSGTGGPGSTYVSQPPSRASSTPQPQALGATWLGMPWSAGLAWDTVPLLSVAGGLGPRDR